MINEKENKLNKQEGKLIDKELVEQKLPY